MADSIGEGFLEAVSRRKACVSLDGKGWCAREQQRSSEGQPLPSLQKRKTGCSLHRLRGHSSACCKFVPGAGARAYPHASHSFYGLPESERF